MNTERPRSRSASKRWAFWAGSLTLAVSACGGEPGQVPPGSDPATLGEPEPLLYDQTILDDPSRTDDDRYRDVGMRPLDVYAFFGIEPGMVVADLGTALMYNAHILDHIVGPQGKVHAIVDWGPMLADWRSERTMPAYTQRKAAGALGNVELTGTLEELPADSLDALLIIRHYHDFGERDARVAQLPRFLRVLKPGGILGVMDAHTDKTDERDETVHRMNGALALEEISGGGFEHVASSALLHNGDDTFDFDGREGARTPDDPSDDAPIHRYFIHRWTMKFRKPLG